MRLWIWWVPLSLTACGLFAPVETVTIDLDDIDGDGIPDAEEGEDLDDQIAAVDLISRSFRTLRIEIDAVQGAEPTSDALDLLSDELTWLVDRGHLDKPGGVEIVVDDTLKGPGGRPQWIFEDARDLLRDNAGTDTRGDVVVVHVLYLPGSFEGDLANSKLLGLAYGDNEAFVFRDNLDEACADPKLLAQPDPGYACSVAESGVLLHQLGHLFGLVDNGTAMVRDHRDPHHHSHDVDNTCLMHWSMDHSNGITRLLDPLLRGGEGTRLFDRHCLNDLTAGARPPSL